MGYQADFPVGDPCTNYNETNHTAAKTRLSSLNRATKRKKEPAKPMTPYRKASLDHQSSKQTLKRTENRIRWWKFSNV